MTWNKINSVTPTIPLLYCGATNVGYTLLRTLDLIVPKTPTYIHDEKKNNTKVNYTGWAANFPGRSSCSDLNPPAGTVA